MVAAVADPPLVATSGPVTEAECPAHRPYADNLKVLLIAAIIAGHAAAGYSELEFWPYSEMKEVELAAPTQAVLLAVAGPFSLVLVPLLFLVAGLFTPGSVERRGPGTFARARLVRLGVPFALYVLAVQPVLMYPVHPPGETPRSFWTEYVGAGERTLDTGPLWFVGTLLVFSLVYVAWFAVWAGRSGRTERFAPGAGRLLLLAVVLGIATFAIRLVVPLGGSNVIVTLNVWEWPVCAAMFVLGIVVAAQGWLVEVPERLRRHSRRLTVLAFVGFVAVSGVAGAMGVAEEELWGGPNRWALSWALFESALAVFGSIWLLGVAQRRLDRPLRFAGPDVHRSAYGAFMLQGPLLIGLAMALRPLGAPAEVKAALVAVCGVAGSFALARLLIDKVPGVSRIV